MIRAYALTRTRPSVPLAVLATGCAALAMLLLPRAGDGASLWQPLVALFPESARSCFALACAAATGGVAWQCAEAARQRRALRPALTAALITALFAPASLSVPLWPALLAAAALVALPAPARLVAANDNPLPEPRNPFALAA